MTLTSFRFLIFLLEGYTRWWSYVLNVIKKTVFYYFSTLKEKDVLEQMIMDGVSRLKTAIISLHQKLCIGETESREMGTILETEEDEEGASGSNEMPRDISVDELMGNIASIEDEAKLLQERNDSLQTYVKHYHIRGDNVCS